MSPVDDCWNTIGVFNRGEHSCPRLATVHHCHHCPVFAAAGRSLLDRPLPDDYRRELTTVWAEPPPADSGTSAGAFAFTLGPERLAVDSTAVLEILPMGPIHRVPGRTDPALQGLANVHGRLEPCFFLGAVLGMEKRLHENGSNDQKRLVLAIAGGQRFLFTVSRAIGIIRYRPQRLAEPPVTVAHARRRFTRGIIVYDQNDYALLEIGTLYGELKRSLG